MLPFDPRAIFKGKGEMKRVIKLFDADKSIIMSLSLFLNISTRR
jgi:hypothetical protein